MANYKAVSAGVWSALARWQDDSSGSYIASTVLPGPSDVVYANNFTVTLDVNIVVLELRTNSALNVIAGGLFDFGDGSSVTANCFAGSSTCVRNNTANAKFVIGNVTGGSTTSAYGVLHSSTGTTTITGNVTGGSGAGGRNQSTGILIINGIAIGGTGVGLDNTTAGSIIVNGSVIGGQTFGLRNQATGTVTATTAIASNTSTGIDGSTTGITTVNNTLDASNGRQACSGLVLRANTGSLSTLVYKQNGSFITLVDPATTDIPIEADVRDGISYASATLTGTLVVPTANVVSLGVVYDNGTVGTAQITAASFLSEISSSLDPLAERLRNISTVESTATIIAAFKV